MGIVIGNGEQMECNLEKHFCFSCSGEFLVGTEILNERTAICPYCGGSYTEKVAWTDDELLENLDLGCLSIMKEFRTLPLTAKRKAFVYTPPSQFDNE